LNLDNPVNPVTPWPEHGFYGILLLPMPKRASKTQDLNQWAHSIVQRSTPETESKPIKLDAALISQVMTELGRRGGKKGGKARMAMLTPKQRSKLGADAARSRWAKEKARKAS